MTTCGIIIVDAGDVAVDVHVDVDVAVDIHIVPVFW